MQCTIRGYAIGRCYQRRYYEGGCSSGHISWPIIVTATIWLGHAWRFHIGLHHQFSHNNHSHASHASASLMSTYHCSHFLDLWHICPPALTHRHSCTYILRFPWLPHYLLWTNPCLQYISIPYYCSSTLSLTWLTSLYSRTMTIYCLESSTLCST
jgi:hypothetical protein